MEFRVIKGDLLNTNADVICHQVNLQGVMGGGLALSIATKYPKVNKNYENYEPKKLGEVCFADAGNFTVANCFSQTEDFNTDYKALRKCLLKVRKYMLDCRYRTIAIPYKYGCGIASGNWDKVLKVFEECFNGFNLLIYVKEWGVEYGIV